MSRYIHDSQDRVIDRSRINQHNQAPPGIKCAICDAIYPLNIFQDHLNTHINPKFLTPSIKDNLAKKQKFVLDETNTQDSDPAIKSFLPEQLPRAQSQRRNMQAPVGSSVTQANFQSRNPNIDNVKIDARDVASNLGYLNGQMDSIEMLNIQTKFNLGIQTKQISSNKKPTSKSINNFASVKQDAHKSQKKQLFIPQQAEDLHQSRYEVSYYKTASSNIPKDIKQQKSAMTIPINKGKKSVSEYRPISTSLNNTSQSLFQSRNIPRHEILDQSQDLQTFGKSSRRVPSRTCPDCGGFYCSTCHSTIPPRFRPANLSQKEQLDPKIIAFYKQHVYTEKCTGCHTQK